MNIDSKITRISNIISMTELRLTSEEIIKLRERGFKQDTIDHSCPKYLREVSQQPLAFFNVRKELYIRELTARNIPYNKRATKQVLRDLLLTNDNSYYRVMCSTVDDPMSEIIMALPSSTTHNKLLRHFAKAKGVAKSFTTINYEGRNMLSTQNLGQLINKPGIIAVLRFY